MYAHVNERYSAPLGCSKATYDLKTKNVSCGNLDSCQPDLYGANNSTHCNASRWGITRLFVLSITPVIFSLQTIRQEILKKQAQDAKQTSEDGGADKENQEVNENMGVPQYSEKEEEEYKKLELELRIHLGLNDTEGGE